MDDDILDIPKQLDSIAQETKTLGFDMASEPKTGAFLRALAATKVAGRFLEIGTGTGLSAAWLLDGMDADSTLISLDNDERAQRIAKEHLGDDPRFEIVITDAASWISQHQHESFDFIFADALPGKFSHLELTLSLLREGGIYVIDDLLPQENWPEGHAPRVPQLIERLEKIAGITSVKMNWASGLMVCVKSGERDRLIE